VKGGNSIGKPTYVLDTSAIIYGFNPRLVEGTHFITPLVQSELLGKKTKQIMDLSIASGFLAVRAPKEEFKEKVKQEAGSTGDLSVLSETDLEVVALALELKNGGSDPTVVSDDYSLQNLCTMFEINFKPMMTKGISEEFWWFLYCPACGSTYKQSLRSTICQVCGHQLKRKVYSKKRIGDGSSAIKSP
jgi:UPF0271 protein